MFKTIKNVFNYYFIPIETEVKFNTGSKLKITITKDAKLRIKIPPNMDNNLERNFIKRCKIIAKHFQLHPYSLTLRGEIRYPKDTIILKINNNRQKIFSIENIKIIKIRN